MGIFNSLMQRNMRKGANEIAIEVRGMYDESKNQNPDAPEPLVIRRMAFDDDSFNLMPEPSREKTGICCETVQGFCYMLALVVGKYKDLINLRSLQFTRYMDEALIAQGFPPQSKEQKARILEALELKIHNWDEITGD